MGNIRVDAGTEGFYSKVGWIAFLPSNSKFVSYFYLTTQEVSEDEVQYVLWLEACFIYIFKPWSLLTSCTVQIHLLAKIPKFQVKIKNTKYFNLE